MCVNSLLYRLDVYRVTLEFQSLCRLEVHAGMLKAERGKKKKKFSRYRYPLRVTPCFLSWKFSKNLQIATSSSRARLDNYHRDEGAIRFRFCLFCFRRCLKQRNGSNKHVLGYTWRGYCCKLICGDKTRR